MEQDRGCKNKKQSHKFSFQHFKCSLFSTFPSSGKASVDCLAPIKEPSPFSFGKFWNIALWKHNIDWAQQHQGLWTCAISWPFRRAHILAMIPDPHFSYNVFSVKFKWLSNNFSVLICYSSGHIKDAT